jgi:hypothetical protein
MIKLLDILSEEISLIKESVIPILPSPVGPTTVTSEYGMRIHPVDGIRKKHWGIDLAASSGTDIKSPISGKVVESGFKGGDCGGTIAIENSIGIKTRYCHCKRIDVNVGDIVNKADVIGLSGGGEFDEGRGASTAPHLHFELYAPGIPDAINPKPFLDLGSSPKPDRPTRPKDPYRSDIPARYEELDYTYDDIVNNNKTLGVGQKSPVVIEIKEKLKKLYYSVGSKPPYNDEFNHLLERAVVKFQENNGLKSNGLINKETIELLWSKTT